MEIFRSILYAAFNTLLQAAAKCLAKKVFAKLRKKNIRNLMVRIILSWWRQSVECMFCGKNQ